MTTATKKQTVINSADANGQQVLPQQSLNLSVPGIQPTANLSIISVSGFSYSSDLLGYFLDGNIVLNLELPQAIPVSLTLNICQVTDEGPIFAPTSITINNNPLVNAYTDMNTGYHNVSWTIPAYMLNAGANQVVVSIDSNYTSNLLIDSVTVAGSSLFPQSINFNTPDPKLTPCLSMPLYSNAGYSAEYNSWALVSPGSFMQFDCELSVAIYPVYLVFFNGAPIGQGNASATITVNGVFLETIDTTSFPAIYIPVTSLQTGANTILLTLNEGSADPMYISSIYVSVQ